MTTATATSVAQWMSDELHTRSELYQSDAIVEIDRNFGDHFLHSNDNGNWAINKDVLNEFRKLTAKDAVWIMSERYWRLRISSDDPNKRTGY